ncbi:MAG: glycosyltransferase family A protein [Corynebacterium sp.]|nr:glycosyltransferase family A protein [Corynebacterium sp.]
METYGVAIPVREPTDDLEKVLESLAELEVPPIAVAVNDQSEGTEIAELCERFQNRFPTFVRTTKTVPGGVSSARNGAITAIMDLVDWVCVLDDDSKIVNPPVLRSNEFPDASAVAGHCMSPRVPASSKERFIVDRRTVWTHVIESGLFFRAEHLRDGLLFDEALGTGCPTPWQSAEGTDLLIRCMQRGPVVYDPEYKVLMVSNASEVFPIAKHRRYARGTGRVLRRWCSPSQCLRGSAGPLIRVVRHALKRDWYGVRLQSAIFIGRIEGLLGRTFSQKPL